MNNMKKILMVLMMVFGLSAVFAKPVSFETEEFIFFSDDENKQSDFSGHSDEEIVAVVVNSFPQKIGKHSIRYFMHEFENEIDDLDEKYFHYFFVSKDDTYLTLYQNIGDGRRLIVLFQMKEDAE